MSTTGARFQCMPTALISFARICAAFRALAASPVAASAIAPGETVNPSRKRETIPPSWSIAKTGL